MNDPNALTIKTARDGQICAFILGGDLDVLAAAEFLEHVARAVDDRTERLVLDLAGLTFLDCAGARALANITYLGPAPARSSSVRSVLPRAGSLICWA